MNTAIETDGGAQDAGVFASKDLLGEGNDLYRKMLNECRQEHRTLLIDEWSPTPWVLDVYTNDREHEIQNWCNRHFGKESSPMHGQNGTWRYGSVTMRGRTWFGFKSKMMLELFEAHFPSPNEKIQP